MDMIKAKNLDEALAMLANGARPAAGCTNILVDAKKKGAPDFDFADITGIESLRGITSEKDGTVIGALTTFDELEAYFAGREDFRALFEAAFSMGGPQIRNRATLGGNICDASPACDAGPALLVLGAVANAASVRGTRMIPIAEFFRGVRQTALEKDELLCSVTIPAGIERSVFRKVGLRNALSISVVSLACARDSGGALRLAMGSVAEKPVRLFSCEQYLAETNAPQRDALFAALKKDISPISDLRASAEYREKAAENLLIDVLVKEFGYEIG